MMRWTFVSAVLVLLVGCNVCSDDIKGEADSPDRAVKATWFLRDCGATTDFSTIISLHKPSDGFRADSQIVFIAKGPKQVHLKWEDARHLLVECMECEKGDIFKQITSVGAISVVYQNHSVE